MQLWGNSGPFFALIFKAISKKKKKEKEKRQRVGGFILLDIRTYINKKKITAIKSGQHWYKS